MAVAEMSSAPSAGPYPLTATRAASVAVKGLAVTARCWPSIASWCDTSLPLSRDPHASLSPRVHLFDVDLSASGGIKFAESDRTSAGSELVVTS